MMEHKVRQDRQAQSVLPDQPELKDYKAPQERRVLPVQQDRQDLRV